MKKVLLAVLTLAAIALAIAVLRPRPAGQYRVRGIDVSHHHGEIDWAQVAQSGVAFVSVKASEGGELSDPRFLANVTGARAAGLKVGAYHFFTFCRPGEDQAKTFSLWSSSRRVTCRPQSTWSSWATAATLRVLRWCASSSRNG